MFGCHLNKKKAVKEDSSNGEGKQKEKKGPMWKLRKWTKDGGYKTVVGGTASSVLENDKERDLPCMSDERDDAKIESLAPKSAEKVHSCGILSELTFS